MKLTKVNKGLIKVLCIFTFIFSITICSHSFADEVVTLEANLSDEYKEWNNLTTEEKENTMMPQTIYGEVPSSVLEKYECLDEVPTLISSLLINNLTGTNLDTVSATISDSRYSLSDYLNIRVENQGTTTECWAFSSLKAMETNIAINESLVDIPDFSERHMDYATSKTFTDGTNSIGYNREVGSGGLPIIAYSYLTNGTGAVLEEDMPFEDNENKIELSSIDKDVDTVVTDYIVLPTIMKEYTKDSSGNTISVTYKDANGNEYTDEELKAARNIIKQQLVTCGAISTITASNQSEYYNNSSNIYKAVNYNCNSTTEKRDHAITIVGWDDNYSRDNFAEGAKPSTDGAYIVLNSYGEDNFDNGYIYISYEDYFIESEIYGVQSTSEVDYDTIYQHDFYGAVYQVGTSAVSTGGYAATFKRETSETEYLNDIGVTLCSYASLEIYVNPNGTSIDDDDLVKVAETGTLSSGYHRIEITPITLNSDEFAIVVKQTSESGFYFSIETKVSGTSYANVTSDGRSYFSVSSGIWQNLSDVSVDGVDMSNADVCIKAFTTTANASTDDDNTNIDTDTDTNTDVDTDTNTDTDVDTNTGADTDTDNTEENDTFTTNYVLQDEYIMNISHSTTKAELLNNISTNLDVTVSSEDGTEITSDDEIIKTGSKLTLSNGNEYILIVRGDINKDGKLTLTDVSKLLLHYNGTDGFMVTDTYSLKACDMNIDGDITLTDLSQIIVLYNSI